MIDKIIVFLLFIIIAALTIWLRVLTRQINVLYEAYHKLCEVNEKQLSNMKKITQAMQDQSTHTYEMIENFVEMIEQATTKER